MHPNALLPIQPFCVFGVALSAYSAYSAVCSGIPRFNGSTARGAFAKQFGFTARQSVLLCGLKMPATPILLADDSQDDQFLFKRLLRLSSFTNPVIAVPDGDEAIAYLKGEGRY